MRVDVRRAKIEMLASSSEGTTASCCNWEEEGELRMVCEGFEIVINK